MERIDEFTALAYHFQSISWAHFQCMEPTGFGVSSMKQLDFKDLEDLTIQTY